MRCLASVIVLAFTLCPSLVRCTETATGRIWCLSLRFQEGTDSFGDTLDLSTVGGMTPNGELEPYNGLTYISGFVLNISGQPISGTMQLALPPVMDVNSNGFNDFFESALPVGATTSGTYTTPASSGTVTAAWQRPAGSETGSCSLHLVDSTFGDLGIFNHTFQLLEYGGPVTYTPGSNSVTGSINLVQTNNPTSLLQGPFQFVKVSTNRFNMLILQPGFWTNDAAQTLSYTNGLFRRDPPWTTNYYGLVQFADGDPDTPAPDYLVWLLSIDDSNDANHNGIPDFSDDPQGTSPPSPPSLALTLSPTNLFLSISGIVGHLYDLQQALMLPPTNWQAVISLTLTNATQTVSLTNPEAPAAFWRALAH